MREHQREPWQDGPPPDEPEWAGVPEADAAGETGRQVDEARSALDRPASDYLHLPFANVDRLVGGIAPGNVWFVAAFSGNGKTSFLMSLVLEMLRAGRVVYYLGLESRPHILRTHLACLRLGYDVGDVLSGAAKSMPGWEAVRAELKTEIDRQRKMADGHAFLVDGRPSIDAAGLTSAFQDASIQCADLLIIDHIDHLAMGDGKLSAWEESRRVTHTLLNLTQQKQLRCLIATQLNNDAAKGDRLAMYQPPQPQHVYMGAHKRMIATGMLGLYRPIRTDATRDELKAVRDGSAEPVTILAPQTMGVVCMKHRFYGSREGRREVLRIERGWVSDMAERDRYSTANGGLS